MVIGVVLLFLVRVWELGFFLIDKSEGFNVVLLNRLYRFEDQDFSLTIS